MATRHPPRVVIYRRPSTDNEPEPSTLADQEAKIRAYIASQPGWNLIPTFDDDSRSRAIDQPVTTRRPVLASPPGETPTAAHPDTPHYRL